MKNTYSLGFLVFGHGLVRSICELHFWAQLWDDEMAVHNNIIKLQSIYDVNGKDP